MLPDTVTAAEPMQPGVAPRLMQQVPPIVVYLVDPRLHDIKWRDWLCNIPLIICTDNSYELFRGPQPRKHPQLLQGPQEMVSFLCQYLCGRPLGHNAPAFHAQHLRAGMGPEPPSFCHIVSDIHRRRPGCA